MASKLLSLAALTALSLATFQAKPTLDKAFGTADGNIFESENYARNHARQEKLEVYTITRAEALATEAEGQEGEEDEDEDGGQGETTAPPTPPTGSKKKAKPAPDGDGE